MGGRGEEGRKRVDIKYSPLPSQRRFHESQARFKGFSGPIGSGKSQALCHEAIRLSYLNPGRLGLIGAPTYPMLRDATQATLFEVLQQNGISYEHNKAESALTLTDSGSRILLRAVDEFERLRGTNLAWFGLDELTYTPEEAWLRLEGRLRDPKAKRLCGFAVWTPKGHDWVFRRFVENKVEGYDVVLAKPLENRFLLDQIPDFYERLKHSYDSKFFAQEALGEYLTTQEGLVYAGFSRDRNVRTVERDWRQPILWSLDFNVDPMCSVAAQYVDSELRILDEFVLSNSTTQAACEEFAVRYRHSPTGVKVFGDATGSRRQTTGLSDIQAVRESLERLGFRDVTYRIPRSNPMVSDRVALVNAKLRNAAGDCELVVDPRCRELVNDFEHVRYVPGTREIDKARDPKRTHLSDALGYLIWQECRPQAPAGFRPDRLF